MVNVMDVNHKGKAVYLILIVVIKIVLVMYVVGVVLYVAHEGTLAFQPMIAVTQVVPMEDAVGHIGQEQIVALFL
jgi:hypothetical protein